MAKKNGRRSPASTVQPLKRLPRRNVAQPAAIAASFPRGYISIREAGKRLNRHEQTIYRYIRRGLLRVRLVGWRVLVEEKSVEWWLKPRLYQKGRQTTPWEARAAARRRRKETSATIDAANTSEIAPEGGAGKSSAEAASTSGALQQRGQVGQEMKSSDGIALPALGEAAPRTVS